MTRKQRHGEYLECPIEATFDLIGGKWKGSILYLLLGGPMRYSELKNTLLKVSQRTLTNQLRDLEKDGLISRTVYPEVPPKVEYRLTDRGASLEAVLLAMRDWGVTNVLKRKAA
ncbi:MAG: helix-turn-helix transcriptional regulator [Alphaproteobacteria bacterium]|nr:helix-turn-helix transcriptional regulator [Alphaproteobacteria bacterium]